MIVARGYCLNSLERLFKPQYTIQDDDPLGGPEKPGTRDQGEVRAVATSTFSAR
jgi:hypothetical protein